MSNQFLFVTANNNEKEAFESLLENVTKKSINGKSYKTGTFGLYDVAYIHLDKQGTANPAATPFVGELIKRIKPIGVIMVGIAFGADEKTQKIGDVLVSQKILFYDSEKIKKNSNEYIEEPKEAGFQLLNAFSDDDDWKYEVNKSVFSKVHKGAILTGSKLVNNYAFKAKLLEDFSQFSPIGGEMEAFGIYTECRLNEISEWIIIKGICDWGYNKDLNKEEYQKTASMAAAQYCFHIFSRDGVFNDLLDTAQGILSDEWFIKQNREQIKNLGNRYNPEVNVPTNTKNILESLGKTEQFYDRFKEISDKVLAEIKELGVINLNPILNRFGDVITDFLNYKTIELDRCLLCTILDELSKDLDGELSNEFKKNKQGLKNDVYRITNAIYSVEDYIEYINSEEICVVNQPYLLIDGEGGIGKSHLLADAVEVRNSNSYKSLLFLGQQFRGDSLPFREMLDRLDLNASVDDFLTRINTLAEQSGSRIIIFIDALNEGYGTKIWKDNLPGILEKLTEYPWIGLVMTIRSEYTESLFANNNPLRDSLSVIRHTGFKSNEYKAIKEYFNFYGIKYIDIPLASHEFGNPLFLRLLCEGYRNQEIDIEKLSLSSIYSNYINTINRHITDACGISYRYMIVDKLIYQVVNYRYSKGDGSNYIPADVVYNIILSLEKEYNCKTDLLEQFLSEGVLTQSTSYDGNEYYYVTYEKLEDYLYAELLVEELKNKPDGFLSRHKNLNGDILECLAICLPESLKLEIFEVFPPDDISIKISLIKSLEWRRANSISKKTKKYVYDYINQDVECYEQLLDTFILISTKNGYDFNADKTVKNIFEHKMADRDALFIPLFDKIYDNENSSIMRLLDWCLSEKRGVNFTDETVRLAALMTSAFLISSNRVLRDRSTWALVSLLKKNIPVLIQVMKKLETVDDPYVAERLYAVAFGCAVSETDDKSLVLLADYVFEAVFSHEYVYPNILLRDYAKNIVDYVRSTVPGYRIDYKRVIPPYKSAFPDTPSDEEIEKYNLDYNNKGFKDYHWGQNFILSSMEVEYARDGSPGGYGDFGRYTFQSYFSNWKQIHPVDLKNIAIKRIFELGYDVEKHGQYDRQCGSGRTSDNRRERIGKKYQWIALFELAAQVSDNFKMLVCLDEYGKEDLVQCMGSFEPDIRDIDPTVTFQVNNEFASKAIHQQLYCLPRIDNETWVGYITDLPPIEDMLGTSYKNSQYILLDGSYSWMEENVLRDRKYSNPRKNMWVQIRSYFVKKKQLKEFIDSLSDADFMGRWMPEAPSNGQLFNREYYWSEGYSFFKYPYYSGEKWVTIDRLPGEKHRLNAKVYRSTLLYSSERTGDSHDVEYGNMWGKPCDELYTYFDMKYVNENTVLYDQSDSIICFDSNELLNEKIGFFIHKDALVEFLDVNEYSIFWTILGEKQIISGDFGLRKRLKQPHISGVYYLDATNKLIGTHKDYYD